MIYMLVVAGVFGLLYGEAAHARAPESTFTAGIIAFGGVTLSLLVPRGIFKYTNQDEASFVLTQLMRRAALGSGLMLASTIAVWLLIMRINDPGFFGELYLFTATGIFIFQGFGETMARHVMYLQQTRQYNSNQLVAVLLTVTLLLFALVLYFLAFDLARPPDFHAYFRDLTAITLTLIGYGRAVYLMAHH